MKLQPTEVDLRGGWIASGGRVADDAVSERIAWLLENALERVADSPQAGGWEILYRDPGDGRHWELTFPQSEMQGGGPRRLRYIEASAAAAKYGLDRDTR